MAVSNFTSKLWQWVSKRSSKNAAVPNVLQNTYQENPDTRLPFESYTETESLSGTPFKLGFTQKSFETPDGQLVRGQDNIKALIGCGHLIHQFQSINQEDKHIIGIAGQCFYCAQDTKQLFEAGKLNQFDTIRLSLVCTDCAKITDSGQLCCPKHYAIVPNPDGTKTYLSPEDITNQKRQNTIQILLSSVALLFSSDKQPEEQNNE